MDADIAALYDKVYQYCYFRVHDRDRAEDMAQETFLRYFRRWSPEGMAAERTLDQPDWDRRQRYRTGVDSGIDFDTFPPGKQLAYLYTIARNLCMDYFRTGGREETMSEEQLAEIQVAAAQRHAPLDMLPESVALKEAVDALPEELREIIVLRFVLEEPAASVAKILGISRFAVYRREKEALGILRRCLE